MIAQQRTSKKLEMALQVLIVAQNLDYSVRDILQHMRREGISPARVYQAVQRQGYEWEDDTWVRRSTFWLDWMSTWRDK